MIVLNTCTVGLINNGTPTIAHIKPSIGDRAATNAVDSIIRDKSIRADRVACSVVIALILMLFASLSP